MEDTYSDPLSRNDLWQGVELRERFANSSILVLGCGGTGQVTATLLAHLGVRKLVLCDMDHIDSTNIERYPHASHEDVGKAKTDILAVFLKRKFPSLMILSLVEAFPTRGSISAAAECQLIFGCTDSIKARLAADIVGRRYDVPYIDVGTGFLLDISSGKPVAAGGQVLISRTGTACIKCLGFSMSGPERSYFFPSEGRIDPSSISLNYAVASIAVEGAIQLLRGSAIAFNRIEYEAMTFTLEKNLFATTLSCAICGEDSARYIHSIISDHSYFYGL